MRNIADELEARGFTMPVQDKHKYEKIRRWVRQFRDGKQVKGIGRPKDSNAETSARGLHAINNYFEKTGFAAQVRFNCYLHAFFMQL